MCGFVGICGSGKVHALVMCGFVGICGSGKDICNNMGLFTSRRMCFPLHSDVGRRGGNMNLPVQLHVKLLQLLIMFASEKDVMDDSVRREWCVCVGVWCVCGGVVCVWGVRVWGVCVCVGGCVCVGCGVCVFVQMSLHNLLYSTCTRVSLQSVMYCTV